MWYHIINRWLICRLPILVLFTLNRAPIPLQGQMSISVHRSLMGTNTGGDRYLPLQTERESRANPANPANRSRSRIIGFTGFTGEETSVHEQLFLHLANLANLEQDYRIYTMNRIRGKRGWTEVSYPENLANLENPAPARIDTMNRRRGSTSSCKSKQEQDYRIYRIYRRRDFRSRTFSS